jgi:hypothetical protein
MQAQTVLGRHDPDDVQAILTSLVSEGFLACEMGRFRVA